MFSFCYSNETMRPGILRAAYSKEKAIETRKNYHLRPASTKLGKYSTIYQW